MEDDAIKYDSAEAEPEEGELSDTDDGDYTPLKRPETQPHEQASHIQLKPLQLTQQEDADKMDDVLDIVDSGSDFLATSDSSSLDSDDMICAKGSVDSNKSKMKNALKKRTLLLRSNPADSIEQQEQEKKRDNKFKKYDVWTASIQEESLSENMRDIDVGKFRKSDRNVENYDFSWRYKLDRRDQDRKRDGCGLKRRLTTHSEDELPDNVFRSKRSKTCSADSSGNHGSRRKHKSYLKRQESSSSCDSNQNAPKYISDLNVTMENGNEEIAIDMATKLYEVKCELMIRAIDVLGKELPIELFKETQRIEKDGGMMVMNGVRRRTPGGVFFFLLKNHSKITDDDKKMIFNEDVKQTNKARKNFLATKRDKKVEELKKQLSLKQKGLPAFSSKSTEISTMCHLKPDVHTNLSNPPPSPVTNCGLESSPDYSSHAINHVNVSDATSSEKPTTRTNDNDVDDDEYHEDYFEMNYSDMDLF